MQLEYTMTELLVALKLQREAIAKLEDQVQKLTDIKRWKHAKAHCLLLEYQKQVLLRMEYMESAMGTVGDRFSVTR